MRLRSSVHVRHSIDAARDSMLAHASARMGRGYAFGLHEALDQTGAVTGPRGELSG